MQTQDPIVEELKRYYGEDEHASPWVEVTQRDIDQFGEATHDLDWMHVDPERARRDGPFEGTIAFGFWTMSMLTSLQRSTLEVEYPPGVAYGFNYGFNRLRLLAPVPIGSRIRNHCRLLSVEPRGARRYLVTTDNRVEIEGEEKPAMVAEWIWMMVAL